MADAISAFIPVRLSSTRLPSKAMRMIQGKPCIQYLVDRVKRARKIDFIVICTTLNSTDDELVRVSETLGVPCFRGSEVDILVRYLEAARKYQVSSIVSVDGDDVFCDPSFIDITSDTLRNTQADCVLWKDAPLGSTPVGVRTSALEKVCSMKDVSNTETGWTRFFTETGLFRVTYLRPEDPELRQTDYRFTLDYDEDLRLFEKIYENLREPFELRDIVRMLREKPELARINGNLMDEYMRNFNSKAVKVKLKDNLGIDKGG